MDIACNVGLTSGEYITIDGFDELQFLDHVPYVEKSFIGGLLRSDKQNYYDALN